MIACSLLVLLLINRIHTVRNVIGDKKLTYRNVPLYELFSSLSVNGPFYCDVTWMVDTFQSMSILTDDNLHSYVITKIQDKKLQITIEPNVNLKITQMNIYLNLYPTIENIYLAGISTLESRNILINRKLLTLRTEETSYLVLSLNVNNLNVLFLSAGTTKLIGSVTNTTLIKYYGIGDVDASKLFSKFVDIDANGLGTVWITSTNTCRIRAKGVSTIRHHCAKINSTELTGLAKSIPFFVN